MLALCLERRALRMGQWNMVTRIADETRARITAAWPDILADIASGSLVKDAHNSRGFSRQQISAYILESAERRREWDEAREMSADAFYDEALEIARNPFEEVKYSATGELLEKPLIIRADSAHARTRIDTLKWAARIRNPRQYSDKSSIDLNVKTVDLTAIIRDANARLAASQVTGRVIAGEVVRRTLDAPQHEDSPVLELSDLM